MNQPTYISSSNTLIPTITINWKNIYTNIVKHIESIITYTETLIQKMFMFYTDIGSFVMKIQTRILYKYHPIKYNPTKYIFHKNTYDIIQTQIKELYNYDKNTYLIIFVLLCCYIMYYINNQVLNNRITRLENILHKRNKNQMYREYN